MKKVILLLVIGVLTGCANGDTKALLEAIALTECEIGEMSMKGEVATGATLNPFASAKVYVDVHEVHTAETIPDYCKQSPNEN